MVEKLGNLIKSRKGFSQNAAVKKFSCSQSYINKVVATKCNLRCFRKVKSPKYTQKIERIVKKTVRKLYDFSKNKVLFLTMKNILPFQALTWLEIHFTAYRKEQKENTFKF